MANLPSFFRQNRFGSPFRELTRIQEDMDRVVSELMGSSPQSTLEKFDFAPSCEITEQENNYLMKVDLPGVKKDQVKVEVDGDRLTIRAERKEEKEENTKKRHLSEIAYGSYVRSFSVPQAIDPNKIEAKFDDGVLTVTVPKAQANKAKQISVH